MRTTFAHMGIALILTVGLGISCSQEADTTPDVQSTVTSMIATQVAGGPTPTRTPALVGIVAQDIVKQYLLNCLAQFDPDETEDLEWWWDVATGGREQDQWSATYETTTDEGQERWTVIGAGIAIPNGGGLASVPGRWTVIYGWRHPLARDAPASEALLQFTKRTPRDRCL